VNGVHRRRGEGSLSPPRGGSAFPTWEDDESHNESRRTAAFPGTLIVLRARR
jgi:hypothetical protein